MPITWEHHDAWLLPAIVVCLGYALRGLARPDGPRARRRSALLALGTALVGYILTMNPLPLGYESLMTFSPGPYLGGHPGRPYLMLLRPLSALLLWAAPGALYRTPHLWSGSEPAPSVTSKGMDPEPQGGQVTRVARLPSSLLLSVTLGSVGAIAAWDIVVALVVTLITQ